MAFLFDHAKTIADLTRFTALTKEVGLDGPLGGPGQFTLFAPNDEAFAKAPQDILANHLVDGAKKLLVLHHLAFGAFDESALRSNMKVSTSARGTLSVGDDYSVLRISGAKIVKSDIKVDNGILHVIDRILWPPQA